MSSLEQNKVALQLTLCITVDKIRTSNKASHFPDGRLLTAAHTTLVRSAQVVAPEEIMSGHGTKDSQGTERKTPMRSV